MNADEMRSILTENEETYDYLFPNGMLLTDNEKVNASYYPLIKKWNCMNFCGYKLFTHPRQKLHTAADGSLGFALVGHAFNPLSPENEVSERRILEKALLLYRENEASFIEYFNQWTGLFALLVFDGENVRIYGDAAGMYTVFYGMHNGKIYCASHTKLLGDICGLEFDP